ncbi:MAG TPA: hypothetical protein VK886_08065 [Vicinamibacterales bacterium]|nr:hypothetical protein [Vicinamibacterales bacterium]
MRSRPFEAITFLTAFGVAAFTTLAAYSPPRPAARSSREARLARPALQHASVLDRHLLVAWYGNPWTGRMGILGRLTGDALTNGLRRQAGAFAAVSDKPVLPAYELIAVVAQPRPGPDGMYRRRESREVIERMLREARQAGYKLILDVQTGRSTVLRELAYLAPYLAEPDVYLALDPEFSMPPGEVPGRRIGTMAASEVNDAIAVLEHLIARYELPPKVLIVHQFTLGMLPDKERIWSSPRIDVVLDMDGFGSRALKRHTYRSVLRQRPLEFAGFKLFYEQDTDLLQPADVLALSPSPSVIIYQ